MDDDMRLDLIKHNRVIAHFSKQDINIKDIIFLLQLGYQIRLSDNQLDCYQALAEGHLQ